MSELGTNNEYSNSNATTAIDILQFFAILKRRRYLVIAIAIPAIFISVILAAIAKPTYKSSMTLLISSLYQKTRSSPMGSGVDSDFIDPSLQVDYTAQLNLMQSSQLIGRAVAKLRKEYPDITEENITGESPDQSPLQIEQLLAGAGASKVPSEVFRISYGGDDPEKTEKVLQALQSVYQEFNLEQQRQRLTRGLSFINEQLPEVRSDVVRAENNLERFRQENDLLDPQIQTENLLGDLAKVQATRRDAVVRLQDLQTRLGNIQRTLARSPQQAIITSRLSQSTRYQAALNKIQETELELTQARLTYTDTSPKVVKLMEQRQQQLALLQEEAGRVINQSFAKSQPAGAFLNQGQLGQIDVDLVKQMIDTQTETLGLIASERKLAEEEQKLRAEADRYPKLLAEYNRLKPEVDINQKTLEQLLQAQQTLGLQIAQGGFNWEVLQEPELGISEGAGRLKLLVLGTIAGLMLGVIAAVTADLLDDTIRSSRDFPRSVSLPVFGRIPKLKNRRALISEPVEVLTSSLLREAFDVSYQQLQAKTNTLTAKSIVITSAQPGEGKSTIALGLALSAVRVHQRVLLIDADLRSPSQHQMLKLLNHRGLADLLTDEFALGSTYQSYIQSVQPNLDVLTSGQIPDDPIQLLSCQRMRELIQLCEQTYDLVVVDAPPILGVADTTLLGSYCKGTVLVGGVGTVKKTELAQAINGISRAKTLGIIANGTEFSASYPSLKAARNQQAPAGPLLRR